jgi:heme/copper-type cytochrome/quinol oxidase subunit 2
VRRVSLAVKSANLLNGVYTTLFLEKKRAYENNKIEDAKQIENGKLFWIFMRTWMFFIVSAFYLVFNTLIYFILNVNRIFFSSMIIAKSYQRSNADLNYT